MSIDLFDEVKLDIPERGHGGSTVSTQSGRCHMMMLAIVDDVILHRLYHLPCLPFPKPYCIIRQPLSGLQ